MKTTSQLGSTREEALIIAEELHSEAKEAGLEEK